MGVPEIKALALALAAEGKPFRLCNLQRRATYTRRISRRRVTTLCAIGYCDGGQALDELHREGKLALVETDHLGFKTYVANAPRDLRGDSRVTVHADVGRGDA
jgi:hypothetical protein